MLSTSENLAILLEKLLRNGGTFGNLVKSNPKHPKLFIIKKSILKYSELRVPVPGFKEMKGFFPPFLVSTSMKLPQKGHCKQTDQKSNLEKVSSKDLSRFKCYQIKPLFRYLSRMPLGIGNYLLYISAVHTPSNSDKRMLHLILFILMELSGFTNKIVKNSIRQLHYIYLAAIVSMEHLTPPQDHRTLPVVKACASLELKVIINFQLFRSVWRELRNSSASRQRWYVELLYPM